MIEAGAEFVRSLDALGFEAQGSYWLRPHDLELWRLVLVTVLEDRATTTDPYAYLTDAFPEGALPGPLMLDDVYVKSPSDALFRAMTAAAADATTERPVRLSSFVANSQFVDALVYRADPHYPTKAQADRIARTVAERVRSRTAAATP